MAKPKNNTPTQAMFKLFEKECRHWIQEFGLGDWEVDVFLEPEGGEGHEASCHWDREGKRCSLVLNKNQRFKLTQLEVRKAAFHEVMHLLLAELEGEAMSRSTSIREVNTASHGIINRLSNYFYG